MLNKDDLFGFLKEAGIKHDDKLTIYAYRQNRFQKNYMNDKADQRHEINRFTYSGGCEIMYCRSTDREKTDMCTL